MNECTSNINAPFALRPNMQPTAKSFSSPGSISASIDSLASVPGIREMSTAVTHVGDLLAQGSPHSLNSTSASSLSSSGSLPIHQQHLIGDPGLGLIHRAHNVDAAMQSTTLGGRSQGQSRAPSQNHSRAPSSNSHQSLAMTSRTPSESNSHLTLPSPTSLQPSYPLPLQYSTQYQQQPSPTSQLPSSSIPPSYSLHQHPQAQQDYTPPQQQQQQQPPVLKPRKEKHPFGGMSASSFLTETLPTIYPGSKKGAKSHGDISSSSSSSVYNGKGKKSGSGGPLSSINTRKQQLSPGRQTSSAIERAYSSTSSITSPITGGGPHHHYMTSPTLSGKNHHSSLDAKVMTREMSQGHATEDVWRDLCIRVLTLFNGQGLVGTIEDLNELVHRSLAMMDAFVLYDEINEIILQNGMLTLNAKLGDVPDEKLVARLVEVWSFFFGTVLPYFEGVFLPLQIELKRRYDKNQPRKTTAGSGGSSGALTLSISNNGGSSTGLSALSMGGMEMSSASGMVGASPRSIVSDVERNYEDSGPENVRTMALTGFRDLVILPMVNRLGGVFANLFTDIDASIPVTDTASRMLQMTSVLTSIQSGDEHQKMMEEISKGLKMNWKQFTRRGNRGGFIGLDRRIAPAQQAR